MFRRILDNVKSATSARLRARRTRRNRHPESLEARCLLDGSTEFSVPNTPIILNEDTPVVVTAIGSDAPSGASFEVTQQPSAGHAAFDAVTMVQDGQRFEVGQGQSLRLGGTVYEDVNGNGVQDFHSSDHEFGEVIYDDSAAVNWGPGKVASTVDWHADGTARTGDGYISIDAPRELSGAQFVYTNGEFFSLEGIEKLRFWGRSQRSMSVRVALRGLDERFRVPLTAELGTGGWQKFEADLSGLDTNGFTEIMFLAETPGHFDLDEITLIGDVEKPLIGLTNHASNMGVNLFANEDFTGDAAFVNVTNTMRRWGHVDAPWDETNFRLPLTSEGIPREPAAAIMHLKGYEPGIYRLKFRGSGTINIQMAAKRDGVAEIVPGTLQRVGNQTVADVEITNTGVPIMLQILEVDAANPIRNLELLAPNYHNSTQHFRDEFLDRLSPFSTVRFMDYSATNSSSAVSWSERRPGNYSIQTAQLAAGDVGGVAWEHLIQLSNEAKVDAWINVPHLADDNYLRGLARLWHEQYRSDGRLIVEFSNEVWNPLFPQFHATDAGNFYSVIGPRLVRMREIFDTVWGNDAGRVEIVLAGQAVNQFQLNRALDYIVDNGYAPAEIVDAVSIAVYANVESDRIYDSVDEIMTDLLDLEDERQMIETLVSTAERLGLKTYAYEGGQHLQAKQTSSWDVMLAAQNDPRMGQLIEGIDRIWREAGGDLFMYYTFTGTGESSSEWGLLEDIGLSGSVKWDAMMSILLEPGDANLDGRVGYADFKIVRDHFQQVDVWWEQGDFNRDGQVTREDLSLLWQSLDVTALSILQLNEIQAFARDNHVTLPANALSLEVSDIKVSEDRTAPATLTIRRTGSLFQPVDLQLTSSDTNELVVPSHVRLAQGQATALVEIHTANDGRLDGDQVVEIRVESEAYHDVSIELVVTDTGLGQPEALVAGHRVYLDANQNGRFDASERSVMTDNQGNFIFENVPAGEYELRTANSTAPLAIRHSTVGLLSFTPSREMQRLAAGQIEEVDLEFQVETPDGAVAGSSQITFKIRGVNDAPIPQPITLTVNEDGAPVTAQLQANDIDVDNGPDNLTFRLSSPPPEGTLRVTGSGVVTFDPGNGFQDLNSGQSRVMTATYEVTDRHGATGDAVISIIVQGSDDDHGGGNDNVVDGGNGSVGHGGGDGGTGGVVQLAPRVNQLSISGSTWSTSFIETITTQGPLLPGYALPAVAPEQVEPLAWTNLDRITVRFDQHVLVQRDHLRLHGVNESHYQIASFAYDRANHIATWTLDLPSDMSGIGEDRLLLFLSDDIENRFGLSLDGEWTETTQETLVAAFPSGDGTAGGDFRYRFDVLPGDIEQADAGQGFVNVADTLTARSLLNVSIGESNYDPMLDVNGSGTIDNADFNLIRARQFTHLPDAEPTPQGPIPAEPVGGRAPVQTQVTSRRRLRFDGSLAARSEDVAAAFSVAAATESNLTDRTRAGAAPDELRRDRYSGLIGTELVAPHLVEAIDATFSAETEESNRTTKRHAESQSIGGLSADATDLAVALCVAADDIAIQQRPPS